MAATAARIALCPGCAAAPRENGRGGVDGHGLVAPTGSRHWRAPPSEAQAVLREGDDYGDLHGTKDAPASRLERRSGAHSSLMHELAQGSARNAHRRTFAATDAPTVQPSGAGLWRLAEAETSQRGRQPEAARVAQVRPSTRGDAADGAAQPPSVQSDEDTSRPLRARPHKSRPQCPQPAANDRASGMTSGCKGGGLLSAVREGAGGLRSSRRGADQAASAAAVATAAAATTAREAAEQRKVISAPAATGRLSKPPTYFHSDQQLSTYMLMVRVAAGTISPAEQLPEDRSAPPLLCTIARACVRLKPALRPHLPVLAKLLEKEVPVEVATGGEEDAQSLLSALPKGGGEQVNAAAFFQGTQQQGASRCSRASISVHQPHATATPATHAEGISRTSKWLARRSSVAAQEERSACTPDAVLAAGGKTRGAVAGSAVAEAAEAADSSSGDEGDWGVASLSELPPQPQADDGGGRGGGQEPTAAGSCTHAALANGAGLPPRPMGVRRLSAAPQTDGAQLLRFKFRPRGTSRAPESAT